MKLPVKLLLLVPLMGLAAFSSAEDQSQQLKKIQAQIKSVQNELSALQGKKSSLTAELKQIETQYGRVSRSLRKTNEALKEKAEHQQSIRVEQQVLQSKIVQQRDALIEQIRASYAMGRSEGLKLLLNQKDPAQVNRIVAYYDYLNKARLNRVAEVRRSVDSLEVLEVELHAEQLRLKRLEDDKSDELKKLKGLRKTRGEILAKLNTEISQQGQSLKELQSDEKRLEKLIKSVDEALAPFPYEANKSIAFSSLKGKLGWPVDGTIIKSFGSSREVGKWDGVVIKAKEGNTVRAVSRGRVGYADWVRGYGLLIILEHDNGYMTLYAYNQSLFKEVGEWVEPGEAIATVGNSGGREDFGLYFEIRRKGKPMNPARWFRKGRKKAG